MLQLGFYAHRSSGTIFCLTMLWVRIFSCSILNTSTIEANSKIEIRISFTPFSSNMNTQLCGTATCFISTVGGSSQIPLYLPIYAHVSSSFSFILHEKTCGSLLSISSRVLTLPLCAVGSTTSALITISNTSKTEIPTKWALSCSETLSRFSHFLTCH